MAPSKTRKRLGRGLQSLVSPTTQPQTAAQEKGLTITETPPRGEESTAAPSTSPPATAKRPSHGPEARLSPAPVAASREPVAGDDGIRLGAGEAHARMVEVDRLQPNPRQPRQAVSERSIATLADSIRQTGILQPITVRPRGAEFEIVTGERRWRAAQRAGLEFVPVIVRDVSDEEMLELALVENIQREDLNAIDRATAYRQYCDQFGKKADDVARRLGEDRTTVTNFIRLLELPAEVRQLIGQGLLSAGHGRCLLGVEDAEHLVLLARKIIKEGLSVRAAEGLVRRARTPNQGEPRTGRTPAGRTAHMQDLETRFEQACGTKVKIQQGRRQGRGKIMIDYYSLDDFDRIAQRLGVALET